MTSVHDGGGMHARREAEGAAPPSRDSGACEGDVIAAFCGRSVAVAVATVEVTAVAVWKDDMDGRGRRAGACWQLLAWEVSAQLNVNGSERSLT